MSAHSSYPGLMWSVNVVHRNHCPPGSFCLIVHFQELKFSHKKAGLFKNKCSQIWRYSGMAVLEKKSLKSQFAFVPFSRKRAIALTWLPSARES